MSYVTSTVFGFTSAFSSNFIMFAALRFFTGFGLSGIGLITVALRKFFFVLVCALKKIQKARKKVMVTLQTNI